MHGNDPPKLDYARPVPKTDPEPSTTVIAIGVLLAIVGVIPSLAFAVYGVLGLWYALTKSLRRDVGGDLFTALLLLAIGLIGLACCFRWLWKANQLRNRL